MYGISTEHLSTAIILMAMLLSLGCIFCRCNCLVSLSRWGGPRAMSTLRTRSRLQLPQRRPWSSSRCMMLEARAMCCRVTLADTCVLVSVLRSHDLVRRPLRCACRVQ